MNRRSFLNTSMAGAGALVLGSTLQAESATFNPFQQVKLGNSGLTMTRFCLGTGMRGGGRESNQTRLGQAGFTGLIRGVLERGGDTFDMADIYGSHTFFARAMEGVPRDRYKAISKIWFRPGAIPEPERPSADVVVERFLKELQTDYIDLVLMHCVVSPTWTQDLRRDMELLSKLKEQGKIRAHGVSIHSLEALKVAAEEPWVDSIHTRINPFGLAMDAPPDQVVPVIETMKKNGKGVVGMKIIGEGRLRDDDQKKDESIRFALGLGTVDVLNVGCESLAEVDDFLERVRKVPRS